MSGVVWILGAGFSKSLGGPLLPALLSLRSAERIRAAFHEEPRLADWGTKIFRSMLAAHGWEQKASHPAWTDAEEFLEHLDTAAFATAGRASARRLLQMRSTAKLETDDQFEALAAAAKRAVAAECSLFLRNAETSSERWRPYVAWARALEPDDTVVTFNYDRVVELAANAAGRTLNVVAGNQPAVPGAPKLLKMHGSVDWRRTGQTYDLPGDPEFAVRCDPDEIGIASPGPSKLKLSEQWRGLWSAAEAAIEQANAVVFVGYRFPQTDSYSRERLLGALMRHQAGPHLAVHTVLGAETEGSDSRRLVGMLRYALGRAKRRPFPGGHLPLQSPPTYYTLVAQPLYAEDFLGLVQRSTIIDPHQDGSLKA